MSDNPVEIGKYRCSLNEPFPVITGPCVIEAEQLVLGVARRLAEIAHERGIPLVLRFEPQRPAYARSVTILRETGLQSGPD